MDLNKLFLFTKVVEFQSFSETARKLNIPKSNISRKIAELEDFLGSRLLERNTRNLRMTNVGERLYYQSQPLLEQLKNTEKEIKKEPGSLKGKLRIVSYLEFGIFFLSKVIADFMIEYPEIEVEIELINQPIDLFREPIDIHFRVESSPIEDSSISISWMTTVPTGLFASPAFIKRYGLPQSIDDLKNFPCLTFQKQPAKWSFPRKDDQQDVYVSGPLKANNVSIIYRCVLTGVGIGILAKPFYLDDLTNGRIIEILPETPPLPIKVRAFLPSRINRPLKVDKFLEFCRDRIPTLMDQAIVYYDQQSKTLRRS